MDTRTTLRIDAGFHTGIIFWPLLLTVAHMGDKEGGRRHVEPLSLHVEVYMASHKGDLCMACMAPPCLGLIGSRTLLFTAFKPIGVIM